MANAALSNRERRQLRKVTPRPPRVERGEAVVRVAAEAAPKKKPSDTLDRDSLEWMVNKRQLTAPQAREAGLYRLGLRDGGEISTRSCLDFTVGSGQAGGLPGAAVASMSDARRYVFVIRYVVLRGQVDMLSVMDGVCGQGQTLLYLAGGDRNRAAELKTSLRIALDLIVAYKAHLADPAKNVA